MVLVIVQHNMGPYSLFDKEVLGFMRTCNIFSLREMFGHVIVIILQLPFPIFNPLLLTHNLSLADFCADMQDLDPNHVSIRTNIMVIYIALKYWILYLKFNIGYINLWIKTTHKKHIWMQAGLSFCVYMPITSLVLAINGIHVTIFYTFLFVFYGWNLCRVE